MAPRPLQNATISFDLVSIPVRFYTATKSEDVHFKSPVDIMEALRRSLEGNAKPAAKRAAPKRAPAKPAAKKKRAS